MKWFANIRMPQHVQIIADLLSRAGASRLGSGPTSDPNCGQAQGP